MGKILGAGKAGIGSHRDHFFRGLVNDEFGCTGMGSGTGRFRSAFRRAEGARVFGGWADGARPGDCLRGTGGGGGIAGRVDGRAGWGALPDETEGRRGAVRDTWSGRESWKKYLHPPRVRIASATKLAGGGITFGTEDEEPVPQLAFLGVRSCELHAIAIQDRVFLGGGYVDSDYAKRRRASLLIAVNCGTAGGTCFCVSMKTGPEVREDAPV